MQSMGLHVFNPDWSTYHSGSFRTCTLSLYGSQETIQIPVQVCTKVVDVKETIAAGAGVSAGDIHLVMKNGCSWRIQDDHSEVASRVVVKGLKSFSPLPHRWPRPTVIIGAGYNGIKNALQYFHDGNRDIQMFDRYDKVGGHAWIVQANKTSKLQTEMAAFHVWYGAPWGEDNKILSFPTEWETWPHQNQILAHMHHACERYGILPHIRFRTDVTAIDVVGKPTDPGRSYVLTVDDLSSKGDQARIECSNLYHFPGAYFNPRIINYPGEENFGGEVGYGMNDDIPFDHLEGNQVAILGNGAFAVENVRTCCEYGSTKIYVVTRRKNLPSPRLPCWFCHHMIFPVPATMLLRMFEPMFHATEFGDPWAYWSVHASKDKKNCTIISNSRFGIGDVTFLAVATGRCEYVQDLLKRCTHHALHLEGGRKLSGVSVIIKCLGLIADFGADKLHKVKELIGPWIQADHRRVIYADPLGMNASNFFAFSTGVGSYGSAVRDKYLIDYPHEWKKVEDHALELLPRNKAGQDKPAHQFDVKYSMSCGMIIEATCPGISMKTGDQGLYIWKLYNAVNPFEKFFDECQQGWDQYQIDWRKQGLNYDYVPYPYTREMIKGWFAEYQQNVGPITADEYRQRQEWAASQQAAQSSPNQWNGDDAKRWWKSNCEVYKYTKKGAKTHDGGG